MVVGYWMNELLGYFNEVIKEYRKKQTSDLEIYPGDKAAIKLQNTSTKRLN